MNGFYQANLIFNSRKKNAAVPWSLHTKEYKLLKRIYGEITDVKFPCQLISGYDDHAGSYIRSHIILCDCKQDLTWSGFPTGICDSAHKGVVNGSIT